MPSHEPLGNSFARLKKSRIIAQTAVLVVTGIVITSFFPAELNSHCSSVFFFRFLSLQYFYLCHLFCFMPVLAFLVLVLTPNLHMQNVTLCRGRKKYRKLKIKRVALLSPVFFHISTVHKM